MSISDDVSACIVEDYKTLSTRALASKYSIERKTVSAILKRNGVTTRCNNIPSDTVANIVSDYVTMPLCHIAKKYHVGINTVKRLLRRQGLTTDNHDLPIITHNNIFADHDSKVAAYWAGFLFADGCVSKLSQTHERYALSLNLARKDASHVYAFAEVMGVNPRHIRNTLSKYKDGTLPKTSLRFTISRDMVDDLRHYGIVPRKTYNFVQPKISDDVLPAYIRGWLDGDGTVSLGTNRAHRYCIYVVGNNDAMGWYIQALRRIGYKGRIWVEQPKSRRVYHCVRVNYIRDVIDLAPRLAAVGDIKLERKWVGLAGISEVKPKKDTITVDVREACILALRFGTSAKELSKRYSINMSTIRRWHCKYNSAMITHRVRVSSKIMSDCYHWLKLDYSPAYLAKLFKINIETVKYWKYKLGRAA